MFVGHFAVSFIGKRVEPKISLGTLVLAAMLPDLLWPIFSTLGIEYTPQKPGDKVSNIFEAPFSHSLLMITIWAVVFSGIYLLWHRHKCQHHSTKPSLILFLAVLSHWVLDAVAHKQAIVPGVERYVGLGLWNSLSATIIVEGGFWFVAILVYSGATYPAKRAGVYAFWLVVAFLTFVWIKNVRHGPPPPEAVIGSLIFFVLLIMWAYWMNRVRPSKA